MLAKTQIWKQLKTQISDADLRRIAESDYGFGTDDHYQALRSIVDNNRVPEVMRWEPGETLCLTRWSDYRDASDDCFEQPLVVLFCCIVLLAAMPSDGESGHVEGAAENLIIALDIVCLQGEQWLSWYAEFLAELLPRLSLEITDGEDYLFAHLAHYLTLVQLNSEATNKALDALVAAEQTIHDWEREQGLMPEKHTDILGYMIFNQRIRLWKQYLEPVLQTVQNARLEILTQPD